MSTTGQTDPHSYQNFYIEVLKGLGINPSAANLDALASVAQYEGLNARDNPLNSVVPVGTSTSFNSVGVQNYQNFDQGVAGTVKLLQGSPWTNVVQELKTGTQQDIIDAFDTEYHTWGSSGPSVSSYSTEYGILNGNVDTGTRGANTSTISFDTSGGGASIGQIIGATVTPLNPIVGGELIGGSSVLSAITSPLDLFKGIWSTLTTTDFWIRIGFILLGLVLLVIAIDKMSDGGLTGVSGGSAPETIDLVEDDPAGTTEDAAQTTMEAATKAVEPEKTSKPPRKAAWGKTTYSRSSSESDVGKVATVAAE